MLAQIRMAIKHSDTLPEAVRLIEEIERSVRDDGSISRAERSNLLKRFWALVKVVQNGGDK